MLSRKRNRGVSRQSQRRKPFHVRFGRAGLKAIGTATNRAVRWLCRFARRRPLWFSIMLVVFVVTGSTAFRGYDRTRGDLEWLAWHLKELVTVAPPLDQSLDRVHLGREGNVDLIFRYPDRFREVVKRAQRDRKDILTSYVTLEEAWKAGGVDQVLTIQLIKLPSTDPYTGGRVAGSIHPPEPIQEANFEELGQLLKEIRTLILEGDGTGRGRLAVSGYQVEPMETQLPPRPEPAGEN